MLQERQFFSDNNNKHVNLPIQMIECIDTNGRVHPMRFRFYDENHELQTVNAGDIINYKQTNSDINITLYAEIYERRRVIDIRYTKYDGFWKIMWIRS